MTRKSIAPYPPDWPVIAHQVKTEAGWRCVRCNAMHDPETGYTLTVHHIDLDPSNNAWWNLAALCQRCHLTIQGKVVIQRSWMFEHTPWFRPYVAGYYAHLQGLPEDRQYVLDHIDELLQYPKGQP